ncbi:hypothetical protein L4Y68_006359, partial [Pseudomonas aeruginosa]
MLIFAIPLHALSRYSMKLKYKIPSSWGDSLLILFSCLSGVLRLNRATLQTDRQKHRQKQNSPHCSEIKKG